MSFKVGQALGVTTGQQDGKTIFGGARYAAGAADPTTQFIQSSASAFANAATRSALDGTSFGDNLIEALPDVIGNAVGGAIGANFGGEGKIGIFDAESGFGKALGHFNNATSAAYAVNKVGNVLDAAYSAIKSSLANPTKQPTTQPLATFGRGINGEILIPNAATGELPYDDTPVLMADADNSTPYNGTLYGMLRRGYNELKESDRVQDFMRKIALSADVAAKKQFVEEQGGVVLLDGSILTQDGTVPLLSETYGNSVYSVDGYDLGIGKGAINFLPELGNGIIGLHNIAVDFGLLTGVSTDFRLPTLSIDTPSEELGVFRANMAIESGTLPFGVTKARGLSFAGKVDHVPWLAKGLQQFKPYNTRTVELNTTFKFFKNNPDSFEINISSNRYSGASLGAVFNAKTGNLHIDLYTKGRLKTPGVGTELLSETISRVGPENIKGISGKLWKSNLQSYEAGIRGMSSPTDALWSTPIGKSLSTLGFTSAKVNTSGSSTFFNFRW